MQLPVFSIDTIKTSWKSCYDPVQYLPAGWSGNALGILGTTKCPAADRLWVVSQPGALPADIVKAYQNWCAGQVPSVMKRPGFTSVKPIAPDLLRRWAAGEAHFDEINNVWSNQDHQDQIAQLISLCTTYLGR
jgi:hypothetical protein